MTTSEGVLTMDVMTDQVLLDAENMALGAKEERKRILAVLAAEADRLARCGSRKNAHIVKNVMACI